MTVLEDIRHLPLFRALTPEQTDKLLAAFAERRIRKGDVLFREGDGPTHLRILTEGELELTEENEPKVVLRPISPVGELGSLTGLPRNTTATALSDLAVLEIETFTLMRLFEQDKDLGLAFYRGILEVVGDKVRRDRRRMDDMRANIIRTQKAMKAAREIVLESEETAISKPVCDALDELIENNRRSHYRVTPVAGHDATIRFDGGRLERVVELSEGYIKLAPATNLRLKEEVVAVLVLPQREIPVSGAVARSSKDGVLVKLDLLIDDYQTAYRGYITQLQLLDFVV